MILSLDIGGSKIRIAEVSGTKIKNRKESKTPKKKKEILNKIAELISSYKKPTRICVSIAGFEHNGVIINSRNTDINSVPLKKILKNKFKIPVYIGNDANCAGLAELNYGAGKGKSNFILLTLGTGIGGAIIINKQLYRGNGAAGEIGSMIIEGGKIFEHLASGNASTAFANKMGLPKISSRELELKANARNKKALAVYNKIGHYLGLGLANLAYIFDPEAFILGGGFTRVKHIHPPTKKSFNKFYELSPKPSIIKAKLSDNAGLIGAALLTKQN